MTAYGRTRKRQAFSETRKFWSVHQFLSSIMPGVIGLISLPLVKALGLGLQSVADLKLAVLALLCGLVACLASWLLSFVINYVWSAPAELHREQEGEIARLRETLAAAQTEIHLPIEVAAASLIDQKTFETLRSLLDPGVSQLRSNQSFFGKFPWDEEIVRNSFRQMDAGPDYWFLDERLEEKRRRLHEAITLLLERVYHHRDDRPVANGKFGYFRKGDNESIALYDSRRNEVIEANKSVCQIYDDLVLRARRKFEI